MTGINDLRNEYTHIGYTVLNQNEKNVSILVKTAPGEVRKMVLIIRPDAINVRTLSEVEAYRDYAKKLYGQHIDSKNILTILIGVNGRGHHFIAKNVIYFNATKNAIRYNIVCPGMISELRALADCKQSITIHDRMQLMRYPEFRQYSTICVYLLAAAIIYVFTKTMFGVNALAQTYGISAEKVLLDGETYRLFTAIFFHNGIKHLLGNIMGLVIIGRLYAKKEGAINFIVVAIGGSMIGCLLDCLFKAYVTGKIETYSVGASAAVFALIGGMIAETFFDRDYEVERGRIIGYAVASILLSAAGRNINNGAHIGGVIAGFVLAVIICAIESSILDNSRTLKAYRKGRVDARREARKNKAYLDNLNALAGNSSRVYG